jgi:hypothetical protein
VFADIEHLTLRNFRGVALLVAIPFGPLFYWSITSSNRNYHD